MCGRKFDYNSKALAIRAGQVQLASNQQLRLYVYRCSCARWHLTKAEAPPHSDSTRELVPDPPRTWFGLKLLSALKEME